MTALRLWISQLDDRDLASRLDLLMDHNEDCNDKESDKELIEVLCKMTGTNQDYVKDFHRFTGDKKFLIL